MGRAKREAFGARQRGLRAATLTLVSSLAVSTLTACGATADNFTPRTPVDEESQVEGSASLEAHPPAPPEDVAIGVQTDWYEDTDPSAVVEAQPVLDKYGSWEENGTYGTVWYPSRAVVGADFVPYASGGRWAYDGEWVWVSDYEWGWLPFHYGRWVMVPSRGWGWIPGRRYAGAWVSWAYGPAYVGWAPLAPSYYWYGGSAVGVHFYGAPYYVYCPHNQVFHPSVGAHVSHGPSAGAIASSTPPYIPAKPSVEGGPRIPASPEVNPARTPASPGVGPGPRLLGYQDTAIVRPSGAGVDRARAFASPADAVRVGFRPPASSGEFADGKTPRYAAQERDAYRGPAGEAAGGYQGAERIRAPRGFAAPTPAYSSTSVRAPAASAAAASDPWRVETRRPWTPSSEPSSDPWRTAPSARFQSSAATTRAPAPSYGAARTLSTPAPAPASPTFSRSTSPTFAPASPTFRPSSPSFSTASPSYRPAPSPAPMARPSSPSFSPAPSYRPSSPAPAYRPSAPTFSPAPAARAPSFSPAPAVRAPAPAPRPSTPPPAAPANRAVRRH